MATNYNPQIITNGLSLYLDAGNIKNYNLTEVEVLVVAGGGGGGGSTAGGGGGGGVIYNRNFAVTPGSALTVTVGSGGQGTVRADQGVATNTSGGNSVFGSLTAIGGGKGYSGSAYNTPGSSAVGGSGGGGGYYEGGFNPKGSGTSSAGTAGQGFAGGDGAAITQWGGGGGGGAGGPGGSQVSDNTLRTGGPGLGFNISGSFQYYGGGGGGGCFNSGFSLGGIGGGGNGGDGLNYTPTAGATNTGGGGGGGGYYQYGPGGAAGGSGIVIVRYPGPQKAIGGTVTSVAGHTIHTFTTVGSTTFTPLVATNNSAILGLSDFSGNGNFGTTANSPTYSSTNGGSVSFGGSNEYISVPSYTQSSNTQLTLNLWTKPNSTIQQTTLMSKWGSSSQSNFSWLLFLNWFASGNLYFLVGNASGNNYTTHSIPHNLSTSSYINYTITYNSGLVNMYANGNLLSSSSSVHTTLKTVTTPITIGADWDGGSVDTLLRFYNGNIAQVSIYNRTLTASEIQQNFTASRARFGI